MYRLIFIFTSLLYFSFVPNKDSIERLSLIIFEGSDWCASCRKFEKDILSDSTVIDFLKIKNIELVKVDFPQRKKLSVEEQNRNKTLAEKYDFKGVFPTVILANDSNFIALQTAKLKSTEFIKELNSKIQELE